MNFFKNAMANVLGVGGCKINTIITSENISPGNIITGFAKIYGGKIEQYINGINLNIVCIYEVEHDDKKFRKTHIIQTYPIAIGRSLLPNENLEIPFSFKLTGSCPISTSKFPIKITTNLDIASAIDSSDGDPINVTYSENMNIILNSLSTLGFYCHKIENIHKTRSINPFPFIQEFEFKPHSGAFCGRLDELEVIFDHNELGLDLHLEIDRKAHSLGGILAEALDLDETHISLEIDHHEFNDINLIHSKLFEIISRFC